MDKTQFQEFLKQRKIRQNDVAELLGITRASVSAKAQGKRDFKVREIKKLAKAYNMEPVEIVNLFLS